MEEMEQEGVFELLLRIAEKWTAGAGRAGVAHFRAGVCFPVLILFYRTEVVC